MRRERREVLHRPPDPAWLNDELAAVDAFQGEGRCDLAQARAEAAAELLPARSCGPRRGSAAFDCSACLEGDEAAAALGQRAIAARLADFYRPSMEVPARRGGRVGPASALP